MGGAETEISGTGGVIKGRGSKCRWRKAIGNLNQALLLAVCASAGLFAQGLPVLTTTHAAHQLTIPESARSYPVHLRATVTYYDPYIDPRRPAYFVSDATGGIFVALSALPAALLQSGDLVEVTGVSGAGDFAPIVDKATTRLIGKSHLPLTAPRVSLTQLLTGAEDGQWVEIEGIVRSVTAAGKNIVLTLALSDGDITATTVRESGVDYGRLADARVRLRGNAGPLFNHRRQMTGAHLLFPGLETVTIEDPAPLYPFDSPIDPVSNLLRFTPDAAFRHRVHIRGLVTLIWPGRILCMQDGGQGLCAETDQTTPVRPGDEVDAIGFPAIGEFSPTLKNAVYRLAGAAKTVAAEAATADQAFSGDHDSELVEMEGHLIGRDRAAKDPSVFLSSGKYIYAVVMPSGAGVWPDLPEGTVMRVTGICSVQASTAQSISHEGFSVPGSFRIMLGSVDDFAVVQSPSWWTAAHALWVLALAMLGLVITAMALMSQVRRVRRTAAELSREVGDRLLAQQATKRALDQMEHQAHHDSLTSLANRLMFDKCLCESIVKARDSQTRVGLLYLDLDRFKSINDTLGHPAGDVLLRQASERLAGVAPPHSVLARLGGDEFAFLLPDISSRSQAEATAARVVAALGVPFTIEGMPWHCPASIGISFFPDDANNAEKLQKNADTALYRAKRMGRGQMVVFDALMSERAERSVLVEKALHRALERNTFLLVYQPLFEASGALHGFEALLRLLDPLVGPIGAAEFIPVAEEIGLMVRIGEWVLKEACRQWAQWTCDLKSRGSGLGFYMAVNVSPAQLTRRDFPALVRSVLDETGMAADCLELELTESGIFSNADFALPKLKALGVRIAVDDFGTGYSSLSSLHGAPIDCVKIDRSFVRDAASPQGTLPFIRTIVSLARSLGMKTVAEGVETIGQRDAVRSAGCDILQGFLLSRPLSADDAGQLLFAADVGRDEREAAVESEMLMGVA